MRIIDEIILPEDPEIEKYVVATYFVRTKERSVIELAYKMANEQTVGEWIKLSTAEEDVDLKPFKGKVLSVWECPDIENENFRESDIKQCIIQLAIPSKNFGGQIPMLLSSIFGNICHLGSIKLIDIALPRDLVDQLPGPNFGIDGLRELLGISKRPLLSTTLKPPTGYSPKVGAHLLYEAAVGGSDIIKDDEVMGDTVFSPVIERVKVYAESLKKAIKETGEEKIYAVNVTDHPERCIRKAEKAVKNGASALMINFLSAGISLISSLARNKKVNVPILAHLNFGGVYYASPYHGISSHLVYGKIARLAGSDMVMLPNPYGKFGVQYEKFARAVAGLRGSLFNKKRTFPFVGGSIKANLLPKLFEILGFDFGIGVGGAVFHHPLGVTAGAKAFRQAIDILVEKGKFDGSEKDFAELKAALEM
ncbi:MAG: RuBisCO large subunit C-terminal-like domain-containing protein [Nitrososphaerota archaeon]|nr:RuBisCO large subunit C-terminal-like domain-containing protein [Candidatus Bathyarchaeota archaeon]MDW8048693.1 RuBisCO large subunit C-terminal-like domain-containing protein [Nitrososphaerota archaeon]